MASYNPNNLSPDELSCPICFEEFSTQLSSDHVPKLLLCLHTFCLGCIRSLLKSNKTIQCSICRTEHMDVTPQELFDNYVIMEYVRKQQEESDALFALQQSQLMLSERPNDPSFLKRQEQVHRDAEVARQFQQYYDQGGDDVDMTLAGTVSATPISVEQSCEVLRHSEEKASTSSSSCGIIKEYNGMCKPIEPVKVNRIWGNPTGCSSSANSTSSSSSTSTSSATTAFATSSSSSDTSSDDCCSSQSSTSSRLDDEFVDTVETMEEASADSGAGFEVASGDTAAAVVPKFVPHSSGTVVASRFSCKTARDIGGSLGRRVAATAPFTDGCDSVLGTALLPIALSNKRDIRGIPVPSCNPQNAGIKYNLRSAISQSCTNGETSNDTSVSVIGGNYAEDAGTYMNISDFSIPSALSPTHTNNSGFSNSGVIEASNPESADFDSSNAEDENLSPVRESYNPERNPSAAVDFNADYDQHLPCDSPELVNLFNADDEEVYDASENEDNVDSVNESDMGDVEDAEERIYLSDSEEQEDGFFNNLGILEAIPTDAAPVPAAAAADGNTPSHISISSDSNSSYDEDGIHLARRLRSPPPFFSSRISLPSHDSSSDGENASDNNDDIAMFQPRFISRRPDSRLPAMNNMSSDDEVSEDAGINELSMEDGDEEDSASTITLNSTVEHSGTSANGNPLACNAYNAQCSGTNDCGKVLQQQQQQQEGGSRGAICDAEERGEA